MRAGSPQALDPSFEEAADREAVSFGGHRQRCPPTRCGTATAVRLTKRVERDHGVDGRATD